MSYTQAQLQEARRMDESMIRERSTYGRIGKTGRMTRRLSLPAYMTAMKHVGVDAPADVKERYFQDNERLYFGLNAQQTPPGLANRHGRVRERTIYGQDSNGNVTRLTVRR
jgi:hypothetical protein